MRDIEVVRAAEGAVLACRAGVGRSPHVSPQTHRTIAGTHKGFVALTPREGLRPPFLLRAQC
jgi:hypothetical protein